mmetsp:Transcript_11113/g.26125  ORF Transcript_11113/g.26125 Transcript_11113/m.26125 type:complete len:232 (-) Transcript_11113:7-702(-)
MSPHIDTIPSLVESSGNSMSAKVSCATPRSASAGHSENQSIVQHVTKDGKLRSRPWNASPTGENARTMWRLLCTLWRKRSYMFCFVRGMPSAVQRGRTAMAIWSWSAMSKMFGTSPELSTPLISSRNDSSTICESVKRKTVGLPSFPARSSTFFTSSRHSNFPYPLAISIEMHSMFAAKDATRVMDCRPEPPTPRRSALPLGCRRMREMRETCPIASMNITSFIGFFVCEL